VHQRVWTGVTILVAMTSNAPPRLLPELHVAHYTGLVRLAALLLGDAPPAGRHPLRDRNLPESTVSDWSPSPWGLSRFPLNVGGGLHDRQAAITGSS
jgi:hypothetical protein